MDNSLIKIRLFLPLFKKKYFKRGFIAYSSLFISIIALSYWGLVANRWSFFSGPSNAEVSFMWVGGVTPSSAKVRAKLSEEATVRLVASTQSDFSNPIYGNFSSVDASTNYMANVSIQGLNENTRYFYALELDGVRSNEVGSFYTVNYAPYSYNFVVSACANNSNHLIFNKMDSLNPKFYLNIGDIHYADPNSSDVNIHRQAFENNIFSKTRAINFFKKYWLAYMWDDHDYSGDGSDSLSTGRASARQTYREYIPHFDLPAGIGDRAVYQAFTVGRVRFILTDLRSTRLTGSQHLSPSQKEWFKNEVLQATLNKQMILWVSPVSYSGNQADNWGGFATERTELADFFKANQIKNMMILCGDAHMIAIDNGSNSDFSSLGNNPYKYPILQAAAFNRLGSNKGGTYSEGTFLNPTGNTGQFVEVKIIDNGGDSLYVDMKGIRVTQPGAVSTLVKYKFGRNLSGNAPLPIQLTQFKGQALGSRACQLQWNIAEVGGINSLSIEKSLDGQNFFTLHNLAIKPSLGQTYTYVDELFAEDSYYRLKINFANQPSDYSQWLFVRYPQQAASDFLLYPNPLLQRELQLKMTKKLPEFTFELLSLAGKSLYINTLYPQELNVRISLPPHIPTGHYLYRIKSKNGVYKGKIEIF
jgi:hypothetical protein